MLTIDQIKALSPHDRYIYLWQCRGRHDRQEEDQPRWKRQAEQARLDADAAERWAVKQREEWEASRAYFATLEAAGLWPVGAPAPATTALRGELLMSGQTEAIDALDRLAKDGEG